MAEDERPDRLLGSGQVSSGGGPSDGAAPLVSALARRFEALLLPLAFVAVVVAFGILKPNVFLTGSNVTTVLGQQAVLLVLALGLMAPLTVGAFDLSAGAMMMTASMVVAVLTVNEGWSLFPAIVVALAIGAVVGLANGILVSLIGEHASFVITLGTSSALIGITYWISQSSTISNVPSSLVSWVYGNSFLGVSLVFWYALAFVVAVEVVWSYMPLGQRMLFVGRAPAVARLSGLNVRRVRVGAFMASGLFAATAGILYLGVTSAATPSTGANHLLSAYAAVFLGTTTIRVGRFNAIGTILAVYFLGFGIAGFELLGAQEFVQQLFYGLALVAAISGGAILGRHRRASQ